MKKQTKWRTTDTVPKMVYLYGLVWLVFLTGGFASLLAYSKDGDVPPVLDAETVSVESGSAWKLIVAVHPKCPCTAATISELERLLPRLQDQVEVEVYAFHPPNEPMFATTRLVERISRLDEVKLVLDPNGTMAETFLLTRSGGCVMLDPDGNIRFRGGITSARGHEGDSVGQQIIRQLVVGEEPTLKVTKVYGCPIVPKEKENEEVVSNSI